MKLFFSSRRRHTRYWRDWSSDVCSSDLEEYAAEFDKENPSAYGQNQVATGPYMIENDESGKAIGYQAGRRIHLVRNPNWDAKIGRAPCREREEISVGAVSLKKKNRCRTQERHTYISL